MRSSQKVLGLRSLVNYAQPWKGMKVIGRLRLISKLCCDALSGVITKVSSINVGSFLRTAAGKMAAAGLATAVMAVGVVVFVTASSTTAHAVPDATTPAAVVDLQTIVSQRDRVLAADSDAIDEAFRVATATNRDRTFSEDSVAIATEADRLKNLATFLWPAKGKVISPFGNRRHPILGYTRMHKGVDVNSQCGVNVVAAQAGTVVRAENGYNGGEGNVVFIDHGDINGKAVGTDYLHLRNFVVREGQYVKKGQLIGYVGSTGLSSGCHLHLQVTEDDEPVNPLSYFPNR